MPSILLYWLVDVGTTVPLMSRLSVIARYLQLAARFGPFACEH